MTKIYSDSFPYDVTFLTPGKRYEVVEKINDYNPGKYQAIIVDDNGRTIGPINVGWPCAYLNDEMWSVEDDEAAS